MAKIFSFTKSAEPEAGNEPEAFVDDGELLEFPQAAKKPPTEDCPESIFASDWTNQELADLYRAHALIQAAQPGLESDRGISDEGDPWFLIGKSNGDVLVHICRIQGMYILDSVALSHVLSGSNFNALVENFLATVTENREETTGPSNVVRLSRGGTVCLHPSMMIAALVWTLLQDADELTLPFSTGVDGTGESKAVSEGPLLPDAASLEKTHHAEHPEDPEEDSAFLLDSPQKGMSSQRDDKLLSSFVPSYSHALTISAGVYASLGSIEALWKFTQKSADTSTSVEEIEASETSGVSASLELLPTALTLLSSLVDLDMFESSDGQGADSNVVQDETGPDLAAEGLGMLTGQEMLTEANEAFNILTNIALAKKADSPVETIDRLFDEVAYLSLQDGLAENNPEQDLKHNAQDRISDGSIKGITSDLASFGLDISELDVDRYATSSLKESVGKFDGELQKYSEILENESNVTPEDDETLPLFEMNLLSPDSPSLNAFNHTVRAFLDDKIKNSDLEILVFAKEILFVDTAAFSGNSTSISWQLEDGGLISMIGLSSELSELSEFSVA